MVRRFRIGWSHIDPVKKSQSHEPVTTHFESRFIINISRTEGQFTANDLIHCPVIATDIDQLNR